MRRRSSANKKTDFLQRQQSGSRNSFKCLQRADVTGTRESHEMGRSKMWRHTGDEGRESIKWRGRQGGRGGWGEEDEHVERWGGG